MYIPRRKWFYVNLFGIVAASVSAMITHVGWILLLDGIAIGVNAVLAAINSHASIYQDVIDKAVTESLDQTREVFDRMFADMKAKREAADDRLRNYAGQEIVPKVPCPNCGARLRPMKLSKNFAEVGNEDNETVAMCLTFCHECREYLQYDLLNHEVSMLDPELREELKNVVEFRPKD